ncbi:DUF4381 domain-containing protein [Shewanella sp. KT0246]|uniref:DUF4381 domain-containing protein n=1 Tax=Shewanella sp. KT0246 TaxID=2815912 RepID=UPI001BBC9EC8|nr:DUF4381 domain-containing protein [Shewanella sp. KT0246]GIU50723.1 hypothetical protein TUM4249_12500 [Shewanella sp. KT0246]
MSWFSIPKPENFGNYMLTDFQPMIMPHPVSLLPQTPVAKMIVMLFILLSLYAIYRCYRNWKLNAYRRDALKDLKRYRKTSYELMIASIPLVLKHTAIHAYPDQAIASLMGDDWATFLNQQVCKNQFDTHLASQLIKVSFQSERAWKHDKVTNQALLNTALYWIKHHQQAKK